MKKGDLILIILIAAVSLSIWGIAELAQINSDSLEVTIKSEGKVMSKLAIDATTSASYTVENKYGKNVIWVEDGLVQMHEASCKNQICVKAGHIHKAGQSIVCLPNRVVVEIKNKKPQEIDAISE